MKLLKTTNWKAVFENWRQREASNPGWIRCATEVKGWPDWESWRRHSAGQIRAEARQWNIYAFTDPLEEIPAMLIGPYSGWQSKLPTPNIASFDDLLAIPERRAEFSRHEGVLAILAGLPFSTEFIGVVREDTNQVVCLEGNHRATAITLAKLQGKPLDFRGVSMTIASARLPADEAHLLDKMLRRGSSKQPQP